MKLLNQKIMANLKVLMNSAILVFKVSKLQVSLVLLIIILQGLLPVTAATISASILDYLAVEGQVYTNDLLVLCILWGGMLFLYDVITPLILFLQSNIADKAVFQVNKSIMVKANSIKGLEFFESPAFHDDIQILVTQSYNRPLNLVVTLVGLIKDFVIVLSCLLVLFKYISWLCEGAQTIFSWKLFP